MEVTRWRILTLNGAKHAKSRNDMPFRVRTMADHIYGVKLPQNSQNGGMIRQFEAILEKK